jgi:hypothetical protein
MNLDIWVWVVKTGLGRKHSQCEKYALKRLEVHVNTEAEGCHVHRDILGAMRLANLFVDSHHGRACAIEKPRFLQVHWT